jgi:hypothetical protein
VISTATHDPTLAHAQNCPLSQMSPIVDEIRPAGAGLNYPFAGRFQTSTLRVVLGGEQIGVAHASYF